jgi:hypothetical protein
MLRKLFITIFIFFFFVDVESRALLEHLGTRDIISEDERLNIVKPLKAEELSSSNIKLKKFLKKYGTLKLSVFKNPDCNQIPVLDEDTDNESAIEGPPEKSKTDNIIDVFPSIPQFNNNIFSGVELPKSLGPELVILDDSHLGEYIKFGLWSENLRTWNIFKLHLYTYKADTLATELTINEKNAKAEIRYQYKIGQRNTIELKVYNQMNHDVLSPTTLQSGGQVLYKFKIGRHNFGIYFFGTHELGL